MNIMNHLMGTASRHSGIMSVEGDAAPPAGGDTGGTPAWYAGADAEVVGHFQNRGWDKLTPAEAAIAAAKAHREAEKYVGAPADQLARIPTDPKDEAGWTALRVKLGRPVDAAGYDFSALKYADGSAVENGYADYLKNLAFQRGLSKDDATAFADGLVKYQDQTKATALAESTAKLEGEKTALKTNWGANYDANMLVAKNTAAKLGISPEAVAALEGAIGYKGVMEHFQKIGSQMGEDKFVNALNPANPGIMTREAAVARKAELMNDVPWRDRYLAGGSAENRELQGLLTIIVGDDTASSRAA